LWLYNVCDYYFSPAVSETVLIVRNGFHTFHHSVYQPPVVVLFLSLHPFHPSILGNSLPMHIETSSFWCFVNPTDINVPISDIFFWYSNMTWLFYFLPYASVDFVIDPLFIYLLFIYWLIDLFIYLFISLFIYLSARVVRWISYKTSPFC